MPNLSKMGWGLLGLCFFLYLAGLQAQSGLLFLILGIIGGCFVLNLFESRRAATKLRLHAPRRICGTEGHPAEGLWEVRNPERRALGLSELSGPIGTLLRVGAIPPGDRAQVSTELVLPRRGVFPYSRLRLSSSYPFGLWRWHRHLRLAGEIVAYPEAYDCPAPPAAGFEPMVGGRYTGRNRGPSGDHFHGVRPMTANDPVKRIHWASSSKGLGLMVKEFDEELSGRVALLMAPPEGRAGGEALLDWTARAAASLVLASQDAGHQVEFALLEPGRKAPETLAVPPFADAEVVLDALARCQSAPPPDRTQWQAASEAVPKKAALCFIVGAVDAALRATICADLLPAHRRVAVYLAADAPDPDLPAEVTVRRYGAHSLTEAA